jgi:hypothetical protein
MSIGWIIVVAHIPERPPVKKFKNKDGIFIE